jgi:hypothetical protein
VTRGAKVYIDAVIAAGTVTVASAVLYWKSASLLDFSIFVFLFVGAATLKCRVPGVTGTYSPVFFFALLGSTVLSFSEVAIASALAGIVQSFFRARRRPSLAQVCFNASNLALSSCAGLLIVQRWIPGPLGGYHVLPTSTWVDPPSTGDLRRWGALSTNRALSPAFSAEGWGTC